MDDKIYPLQFNPILKERIWGGKKLKTVLDKPITSAITGESWELSTVEGDISCVANGILKGKRLSDVIQQMPEQLLGTMVYARFGTQFPLLFKYLDAHQDLSIQVHPNDALAQKRHNSFGKTEMWYVMQADPGAKIIVGFKEEANSSQYIRHLKDNSLLSILDVIEVQKGDAFFLDSGTIHAIGSGLLIAEIQQTSDITYRLYDYDRVDAQGNKRELHVDLALEAINYHKVDSRKVYLKEENQPNSIVNCPYFSTNLIPLSSSMIVSKTAASFTVYMCLEGAFLLEYNLNSYSYKKGDTVLIPAAMDYYTMTGKASILEIYIS
ncbi:type I phosphomannose isomerase catalytic subunit [Flavobacterium crassostreae]|uniref:Phosphohexomutase n=1 Tax=Flavobacterium crassostreae TaxID=1763534 RepID=A0A1B9E3K2_9FLAO|nr:type I phosphomannose isomerase catalytic subunit [Flavobacterium crassostreae]OCB76522.1 mannose-6-phosphate isomerase [Flavobacterium crassostreae]